jgi:AcrR family transcriptional regulator
MCQHEKERKCLNETTPVQTLTRQSARTQETQSRLLRAAEQVFVRDGFEGAQLDEIATRAGRSKGSVYIHFKNKEDLFLALFEYRTKSYVERLSQCVQKCTDRKQSLEVFREFCIGLVRDRAFSILTLEFKLYALRHPESKERLRNAHEVSKATAEPGLYAHIFGEPARGMRTDNDLSAASLGPIISGLILESNFEPAVLSEEGLRRILGRIFDALFPAPI